MDQVPIMYDIKMMRPCGLRDIQRNLLACTFTAHPFSTACRQWLRQSLHHICQRNSI